MVRTIPVIQNELSQSFLNVDHRELLELLDTHGAVLLRDFTIDLVLLEAFSQMICEHFHVVGTRVSSRLPGDSYSTEVFRDNFSLLGHAEGSYRPHPYPPDTCFFFCVREPDCEGGETLLVDGVQFYERLPHELRQRLHDEGICYEMQWPKPRWQSEFGVTTEKELCTYLSAVPEVEFYLLDDNLHIRYTTTAISPGRTGQSAFINGVLAHLPHIDHPRYQHQPYANPLNKVYFGNGEEFSDGIINQLIDIHDEIACYHRWQANDLLVIDNTRMLHGRTMTSKPCERILFSRFGRIKQAVSSENSILR